jgi:thiol-disulfide isomerase/thioredoxin
MKSRLGLVIVGLLCAGSLWAGPLGPGDSAASVLSTAASLKAPDTKGKVVLLDFWASWCAPCKASFPVYAKINSEYADKGLVVIAVSVDQSESAYTSFVKRNAPPFAVVLDKDQSIVRIVQVPTMPTSYLIGRDGKVRYMHQGFHGAETEATVRAEIESLLKENL